MGFCKSDQKNIPVVGFLTHNDCDILRAKTGLYRRVTHRTIILPTLALSQLKVRKSMKLRKSWTPGSGGVNYGTLLSSSGGRTLITCGSPTQRSTPQLL